MSAADGLPGRDDAPPESPDAETLAFAARVFDLARHGEAADLARLLDQGLPVDLRNDKGDSLLMLAAYNGNAEAARVLLERGADANARNDRGQAPLAGAIFKGDLPMVRLLVEGGAAVDGTGDGSAPLLVAAMFDRVEIAEYLLAAGADPSPRDGSGLGLADLAAKTGASKVARLVADRLREGR